MAWEVCHKSRPCCTAGWSHLDSTFETSPSGTWSFDMKWKLWLFFVAFHCSYNINCSQDQCPIKDIKIWLTEILKFNLTMPKIDDANRKQIGNCWSNHDLELVFPSPRVKNLKQGCKLIRSEGRSLNLDFKKAWFQATAWKLTSLLKSKPKLVPSYTWLDKSHLYLYHGW